MDPASSFRFFEPQLTVFYCERCCGAAPLGLAGGGHRCRLIPGCAGQVGAELIGKAFAEGADGVLILGCVGRTYEAPLGDLAAFRHIHQGTMALHRLGLDPVRLRRSWVTPRDAARVPALINAFRRRLAVLGPRRPMSANPPAAQPVAISAAAQS